LTMVLAMQVSSWVPNDAADAGTAMMSEPR
jgi:hypothetical protein